MKILSYQKITFFTEPKNFIFQKEFKKPIHSLSYEFPNLLLSCTLKIEILNKFESNLVLFDGKISEYNTIISRLFNKEISNEIILSPNQNLNLSENRKLLITIMGNYAHNDLNSVIFKENKLFTNSYYPLIISKHLFTREVINTSFYNKFTLLDFSKIDLIESINDFKDITNEFSQKNLSVHSNYFINTNSHLLTLFENQKIKLSYQEANSQNNFYLIKF